MPVTALFFARTPKKKCLASKGVEGIIMIFVDMKKRVFPFNRPF